MTALHALPRTGAAVTLVDSNVYSTFQPLLYEVATAGLTAAERRELGERAGRV